MLSNLLVQLGNHTNAELEETMVRHMILNSLRSYKAKFADEYGEMVICCDSTNIWRKQIFPYYKANRKTNMEKSELDWKKILECMSHIRAELKEYFPYRVIDVDTAEADDVIGTLVNKFSDNSQAVKPIPILILSADKDFIQLHKYQNVKQYDAVRKKWIVHDNPAKYLQEHIMKGDAGDGIPNVLSSDNCFVIGERQTPMTTKRLENLINTDPSKYDTNVQRNYDRNRQLIDLNFIPKNICIKVMEQYENQINRDRSKLMKYFMSHHLKNLMENISEF